MVKELKIENLKCVCIPNEGAGKVVYMIYPEIVPFPDKWLEECSVKYEASIVMVYIPASGWNNMLTPWPEPGETPDSPPFGGEAAKTLALLKDKVIPAAEDALNLKGGEERELLGVSLSGLFTLWQWMQCDLFDSVACLSGSFWYPGFIDWFNAQPVPDKKGSAFFLLGVKEPKAWIKEYRSVGENTEKIVERLESSGISTIFQWVPGDHFADPSGRAESGLENIGKK